jgi:hypothetical protein
MIILIAFHAKMSILGYTIKLSSFWRNFSTIITNWSLCLLFFICINHIIDNIDGKNLIVFKNNVLMLEHLWIFFFIVKIDRLEAIRTLNGSVYKLTFVVTV